MKFVCSLLVVESIEVSRNFYENILNQKVKYDFGENVTFEGDFSIHLKSHYKELINGKEIKSGGNNFELYFEEDHIENLEKKLNGENVKFIHKIKEQPWCQKVLRFYDPDSNIIEVGESIEFLAYRLYKEGKEVEEISKLICMPEEFVLTSIEAYKKD